MGSTDVHWSATELRGECDRDLRAVVSGEVRIGDLLAWRPRERFDVAITNPPYRIARDVVEWCLAHATVSALLLRLNFLGSEDRAALMRAHPPDVYVLPNRPSFDGRGTDSIEYAWFVWDTRLGPRDRGSLAVLEPTSLAERRAG